MALKRFCDQCGTEIGYDASFIKVERHQGFEKDLILGPEPVYDFCRLYCLWRFTQEKLAISAS